MDIVYILKAGYDNSRELKYSLRSLKNIKFDNIYIIGHLPNWCINIKYIPTCDPYNIKSLNALHKIKIACNTKEISDDFILMNDDFYITKPTEIKYWNKGTIKGHLEDRQKIFGDDFNNNYIEGLKKTYKLFPNGLDFSLHYPIIYNKKKFLDMCDKYDMSQGYLLRSLYCNHYGIKGEYQKDNKAWKLKDLWNKDKLPTFISSNDNMVLQPEFINFMEDLFEKSKFEIEEEINIIKENLFTNIKPMQLKGTPNQVINRFGKRYEANEEGIIDIQTKEELEIFVAYGFELIKDEIIKIKKPLKSKNK